MSNPIKYSTGTESLALKKGNFYIGTGDVGKGPTSTTGYYNGISPPSGGYTIYLNKETGGPSIYTASNDAQLISLTNSIAGTSYTTANECLVYYAGQTDKVCLNRDYEGIVTDGLVLNLDAGFTPSYPKNGTTWYDISLSGNNGTLTNGPTFNSDNGGSIVFDGADDYVSISENINPSNITLEFFYKALISSSYEYLISNARDCCGTYNGYELRINRRSPEFQIWNSVNSRVIGTSTLINQIYHISATYDGSQLKIYQNGVLTGTSNSTLGIGSPPSYNLAVGGMGYRPAQYNLTGNIYVGRVYNRALSADEVLQNYNAQKGRFGL
jgi:hypothetical protein